MFILGLLSNFLYEIINEFSFGFLSINKFLFIGEFEQLITFFLSAGLFDINIPFFTIGFGIYFFICFISFSSLIELTFKFCFFYFEKIYIIN